MNEEKSNIAVVILAGGRGSRIGGGKPQLRLGDATLIDRALAQAAQWSDVIAVASPANARLEIGSHPLIEDDPELDGPLGGLAAALRFARDNRAAFMQTIPVDTPFLPEDLLQRLRAEIGGCGAAIPSSGGRLHSVCGLWRASTLDHLPAYAATGRRALLGLADAAGFATVEWPAEPIDPFFNINTEADLADAKRLLAAR